MDKLHEAFITAPKKDRPCEMSKSMLFCNAMYLSTEWLMNVMCYLLRYQVLDLIFCCFLDSEVLVDVKK